MVTGSNEPGQTTRRTAHPVLPCRPLGAARRGLYACGETDGADNPIDLVVDDIINYGDSILVIGKARGLPLRARIGGGDGERLRPGATLALAWAPVDAHILARR